MGKHSTGRARSGRDAAEDVPAADESSAGSVAVDTAPAPSPAPAAFSGWLPPPVKAAEPAAPAAAPTPAPDAAPAPAPAAAHAPAPPQAAAPLFSAAPSALEVLAAPVLPAAQLVVPPVPTFATPAQAEVDIPVKAPVKPTRAARASKPEKPGKPEKPAVPALAEAFAAGASTSWFGSAHAAVLPEAPHPSSALELLAANPVASAAAVLEPVPDVAERPSQLLATPEQPSETDLPPVPQFRVDASSTTKGPDVVTPGAETQRKLAKARRTRKIGKAGGIALLVGAIVAAGAVGLIANHERPAKHHVALITKPSRTQRTLLFALADRGGDEAALFASDTRAGTSTVTLLPSQVVTNVVGQGQVPLGRAVALANASLASGSISDLLGVDVDASWRVTPAALATLIDSVGGITADVDTDIIVNGVVVIRAGAAQKLGGANAVAYAQYLASGEDETARLARLQRVLQGLLAVLPAQAHSLPAGLGALGAGSESTLSPALLAAQLLNAEAGNRTAAVPGPMFSILPVTTIDSGGATSAYRVDPVAMASYVSQNLAASVPPGALAGGIRVFVYSGTLEYGVGAAARQKLVNAGLSFVGSDNEAAPSDAPSVVLVPDGTDASRAEGVRVARALGLPTSSIEVSNLPQTVADVIVIAGGDFRH